jgi:uncharacterized protein Veg
VNVAAQANMTLALIAIFEVGAIRSSGMSQTCLFCRNHGTWSATISRATSVLTTYPTKFLIREKNDDCQSNREGLLYVRLLTAHVTALVLTSATMMKTSSIPNHLLIIIRV